MANAQTSLPLDPVRHRAHVASIYASLPAHLQVEASSLVADWPRIIHSLARVGELAEPEFQPAVSEKRRRSA